MSDDVWSLLSYRFSAFLLPFALFPTFLSSFSLVSQPFSFVLHSFYSPFSLLSYGVFTVFRLGLVVEQSPFGGGTPPPQSLPPLFGNI